MRTPSDKPKPPGGPYPETPDESGEPDVPGGPAGIRLKEFLEGRFPEGGPPSEDADKEASTPKHDQTEPR